MGEKKKERVAGDFNEKVKKTHLTLFSDQRKLAMSFGRGSSNSSTSIIGSSTRSMRLQFGVFEDYTQEI